eukprot:2678101-Pyramimonas_sp.AAC.1
MGKQHHVNTTHARNLRQQLADIANVIACKSTRVIADVVRSKARAIRWYALHNVALTASR